MKPEPAASISIPGQCTAEGLPHVRGTWVLRRREPRRSFVQMGVSALPRPPGVVTPKPGPGSAVAIGIWLGPSAAWPSTRYSPGPPDRSNAHTSPGRTATRGRGRAARTCREKSTDGSCRSRARSIFREHPARPCPGPGADSAKELEAVTAERPQTEGDGPRLARDRSTKLFQASPLARTRSARALPASPKAPDFPHARPVGARHRAHRLDPAVPRASARSARSRPGSTRFGSRHSQPSNACPPAPQ